MELHTLFLACRRERDCVALSLYAAAQALLASLSPHGSSADQAAALLDLLLALLGQPGGPELLAGRGVFNAVAAACACSLVGASGVWGVLRGGALGCVARALC